MPDPDWRIQELQAKLRELKEQVDREKSVEWHRFAQQFDPEYGLPLVPEPGDKAPDWYDLEQKDGGLESKE